MLDPESMQLEDLMPEKPVFTLSSTGKEYTLRVPNLEDKVEMIRLCGGQEQVLKVFQELNWSVICKIVYRLMIDKSDFLAKREKRINDEGIEEEVLVTGPIMLLRAIKTQAEAISMLQAFNAASVASEPLMKDYVDTELKKSLHESSTGEKSLNSLQPSMATPQNNLETSLTGS